ncbi:MAG: hypothetical protein AB7K71_24075 [Polyangiaceae bacterium]
MATAAAPVSGEEGAGTGDGDDDTATPAATPDEEADVNRWNDDPAESHDDATNGFGLRGVLAYREWSTGGLRVKGGAADLYPWQAPSACSCFQL